MAKKYWDGLRRVTKSQEASPGGFLWIKALRAGWYPTFRFKTKTIRWRKR